MIDYFYDAYLILNKVYSEKAFVKQAISSTFIEEKNRAKTVKTVYGVLDKDIELSYYIKTLSQKNPKLVIRTILKISLYSIIYLKKANYAVIDSAVELTKKLGKGAMSGFVNALLRKFVSSKIELPTGKLEHLSIKYSYPEYAVKKLIKDYGGEVAEKIMAHENSDSTLVFFNENGEEYLKNIGVLYEKTAFNDTFIVKNFVRNDDYDRGLYTYQNTCSVAICDIVEKGENLLDTCSAPGGKSVNLSRKFNSVLSFDVHEHRVELIKSYANRMRVTNVTARTHDSTVFLPELQDTFSACLCDVPCSGYGVVSENPDIKLNREENSIIELNKIQKKILDTTSKYVKVGGYLYYSTCSIFKDENRGIIDDFIKNHDNYEEIDIISPHPHVKDGKAIAFLPHISGGGFFVAKLKRIK